MPELIPQDILDLIDDPRKLNSDRLWQTLTEDEKQTALSYAVGTKSTRDAMVGVVAKSRRSRKKTVASWDDEKVVEALCHLSLPLPIPNWIFYGLWIGQTGASRVFLDALGIPNEDGLAGDGLEEVESEESVHAAADRVSKVFGIRPAVLFILTLICQGNLPKDPLWRWTKNAVKTDVDYANEGQDITEVEYTTDDGSADLSSSSAVDSTRGVVAEAEADAIGTIVAEMDGDSDGDAGTDQAVLIETGKESDKNTEDGVYESREAGDSDDSSGGDSQTGFGADSEISSVRLTELDRLVNRAIIDARNKVTGSLQAEQTDEIVDELAALNSDRPQSFFNRGFADSVFGRSPTSSAGPEANRWYWAGVIRGRIYLSDSAGIVRHYDDEPIVQSLGDGTDAASDEAVELVVQALRDADRHTETADFVKTAALRDPDSELFGVLLNTGTDLLRSERPGEARVVFALLMDAEKTLQELGFPHGNDRFLTVRRRQAHTLRKLNEHEQAESLLRDILDRNPNPEIRAMIYADLGLLEGGFAELEEVCLPLEQDAAGDFIERLRAGEEMFLESIGNDVHYSGHGHYCLGVLALADGDYSSAAFHLERARGLFNSRKSSYGAALACRADLYAGISKAAQVESVGDLSYAARIITNAVAAGTPIPAYLIKPAAEGFELLGTADVQSDFCVTVLESDQGAALDVLADLDAAQSTEPVTQALHRRAQKLGKTEAAAADLQRCFKGCMKAGRHEDARNALDELEVLAIGGVGEETFHDLLVDIEKLQPAWDKNEAVVAQVRCLEARGDLENAMAKAIPLFHEALTMGNVDEAKGIYENMCAYGLPDSLYQDVKSRLDGVISQYESVESGKVCSTPTQRTQSVRVLFVGGNENQEKMEPAIREQLKERAPHVEVKFIFSGWSGNWPPHLERVRKELEGHDVVVLMRFMRTHLGREIRKACDGKPWRSCWPSGVGGITDSIISAADSV
ncbi:MAG: hypothetical protein OXI19_10585 [Gemmatimonadota bacterium]|nr:hypothetical protein [Gemmatimonadota bacterium]